MRPEQLAASVAVITRLGRWCSSCAEGRTLFVMPPLPAEIQRDLIVANTSPAVRGSPVAARC